MDASRPTRGRGPSWSGARDRSWRILPRQRGAASRGGSGAPLDPRDDAVARSSVLHHAVDEGEEGEVAAAADVAPGVDPRPDLAHEDGARVHALAAEDLDAAPLAVAVAAVARAPLPFLVRHS